MKLVTLLKKKFPDSSNRTLKIWLKQKRIEINGKILRKNNAQVPDNQSIILLKKTPSINGLKIFYEDKDLIVVEKPSGMLSVNTTRQHKSVFTILKKAYSKTKVYIIHRLDQETKGLLVFAFNEKTFLELKKQFANKSAQRHYLAILHGLFPNKQGTWKHHLIEDKNTFVKVTYPSSDSKLAISHYQILYEKQEMSLAHIQLKTGRKNQIRVQASYEQHPIVGDKKYGKQERERLSLHAFYLQFTHPGKNFPMQFFSRPASTFFQFYPSLNDFLKPFMNKIPITT